MAHLISAYTSEYDLNLVKLVDDTLQSGLSILPYQEYFNITPTDQYQVAVAAQSGFGVMPEISEGSEIPMDDSAQRYKFTVTMKRFAQGFKVSRMLADYNQTGHLERKARALGNSAVSALRVQHANVLNRAFNSSYTFGDSKELCATDHATAGGTASNETASGSALSHASVSTMKTAMLNTVDHRGKKIPLSAVRVIVPADLADTVLKVLSSHGRATQAHRPTLTPTQALCL